MRVTSPTRTIIDLAGLVDGTTLELAHDELWRRRLITPEGVADRLDRTRVAGAGVLRAIATDRKGLRPNESVLETKYFGLLRSHKVPLPTTQYRVATSAGRRRLDYSYPAAKVAIELDGYAERFGNRAKFDDDRARQVDIEALGWRFLRFTDTHVEDDPMWVVVRTAEAIGFVPARWKPKP